MKIIKETPNLIIIKNKNIITFIVGIVFVIAGFVIIFRPDLFIDQPPVWLGLAVALLGGFIIAVAKITTIKLDKSINKLSFLRKGLTGQSNQEHDLNQIKEVELSATYNFSSRRGGRYSYHLSFVFNNGEIIPLNPGRSSSMRIMWQQIIPERNLGARIATFLGVPFHERRPPTIAETLSTIPSVIQKAAEKETKKQKEV